MGKVVITSKERYPYDEARKRLESDMADGKINAPFRIRERANFVIWEFATEDEAIRYARLFMNLGFEFVQRAV